MYLIDTGISVETQRTSQPQIGDSTDNQKVANMLNFWQGPFLNPTRVWFDPDRYESSWDPTMNSTDRRHDYPVDPWGIPYRMYSAIGIVGTNATSSSNYNSDGFSDGNLTQNEDRFDRFAIVSFGPDGISDEDALKSATAPLDDIVRYFGAVVGETVYYYY
jgi:hypothetical protein